jgi:WD40 repeat protein
MISISGIGSAMMFNPAFGPNGALMVADQYASGSTLYAHIGFYDPSTMTLLKTVTRFLSAYSCMEILQPSGNVAAAYQYLDIYNTTYNLIFSYANTSNSTISSLRQLPDNVTLICGMSNGSLLLFYSTALSFGTIYTAHSLPVQVLLLTPDLVYLVSGATDNNMIIWQWSRMSLTQVKVFGVSGQITSGLFINSNYLGKNIFKEKQI